MKSIIRTTITCLVLFVNLTNAWSQNLSDERRKAILEFSLTMDRANHLIPAMVDMTKYVVSLPDYAERARKSGK